LNIMNADTKAKAEFRVAILVCRAIAVVPLGN